MSTFLKNFTKGHFTYTISATVFTLIMGIILTAKPNILEIICTIAGALLVLVGVAILIYYFAKKRIHHVVCVYSIFFMICGFLLCFVPTLLKFMIPIFFGAWLLTSSAAGMYNNFMLRKIQLLWWIPFLMCTIGALIGLFVITRPVTAMEQTIRIIGIAMIIHSVLRLISVFFGNKADASAQQDDTVETTAVQNASAVIETTVTKE